MQKAACFVEKRLSGIFVVFLIAASILAAEPGKTKGVSFTEDVAPIFLKRCVNCHRPGEVAPMSLLTYEDARPWAKSIRNAVANRDMPPWDADPKYGTFSNDISLSQSEIDTVVQWVDQGARRGDPSKVPDVPKFRDGWKLGEPDYILDMGEIEVPASGKDLFIDRHVRLELPEDVWIRAVEIQPGNREVLHHLVSFLGYVDMTGSGQRGNVRREGGNLREPPRVCSIWAAGTPPTVFREGTGHPIRRDQELTFNIHIHPNGTATKDHSKVGLYFGKGKLEKSIVTGFAVNPGILIPAGSSNTEASASFVFGKDSSLLSFFPHMHLRGKDMTYVLTFPNGKREILLNVPRYDFNWQWIYHLQKPIDVPKGSRLEVLAHWDNSHSNPNNPDSSRSVEFGEGSDWEMLIGFFDYVVQSDENPVSTREKTDVLLAAHPAESSYAVDVGVGFASLNWGMVLPKEGSGVLYVLDRDQVMSTTLQDITWDGSAVTAHGKTIRRAGATIPLGVRAQITDTGEISGRIYIGSLPTPGAESTGPSFTFKGKRRNVSSPVAVR